MTPRQAWQAARRLAFRNFIAVSIVVSLLVWIEQLPMGGMK